MKCRRIRDCRLSRSSNHLSLEAAIIVRLKCFIWELTEKFKKLHWDICPDVRLVLMGVRLCRVSGDWEFMTISISHSDHGAALVVHLPVYVKAIH